MGTEDPGFKSAECQNLSLSKSSNYRPQNEVLGKVMFSQTFAVHGGGGKAGGFASSGICIERDVHPGGLSRPQNIWDTVGYGQQAGGTHPTGIHFC